MYIVLIKTYEIKFSRHFLWYFRKQFSTKHANFTMVQIFLLRKKIKLLFANLVLSICNDIIIAVILFVVHFPTEIDVSLIENETISAPDDLQTRIGRWNLNTINHKIKIYFSENIPDFFTDTSICISNLPFSKDRWYQSSI